MTDTEIPATSRNEKASEDSSARGNSWHESTEIENPNKYEDEELQSGELQGVPDLLQEFKHGLVDESVPEYGDASSSSHELPLGPRAKMVPGKHNILTHFPKDQYCDTCLRTKITRASCRRRTGTVVSRAEIFGDLIIPDHKVLSEGCDSRHCHRYAVVVQDLATQWIQSYPCTTKTSQETMKSLQKFLEPTRNPKVIFSDNSWEFGKACEDLSWNHCTSTPHRSETNSIAERAVRRIKEGTSAVLLQSGLDEKWWADYCYLRNIQDLLSDGKTPCERRGVPFNGPVVSRLEQWSNITLFLLKTYRDYTNLVQKSCQVSRLIVVDGEARNDFLVHFRRFYLPSSRGIQSQTVRAEGRIISYSTEVHRRYQKHRYTGEETDEKTNDIQARHFVARDVETHVRCIETKGEVKVGK